MAHMLQPAFWPAAIAHAPGAKVVDLIVARVLGGVSRNNLLYFPIPPQLLQSAGLIRKVHCLPHVTHPTESLYISPISLYISPIYSLYLHMIPQYQSFAGR